MLKEASFPGLLKKAQVQGGAPHCGMWIADCGMGGPARAGYSAIGDGAVGLFQQPATADCVSTRFLQAAQKGPGVRRRATRRLRRTPGTPQGVRERANAAPAAA